MQITFQKTSSDDIETVFSLCKQLIDEYENTDSIDYDKVLNWVHRKLEKSIEDYSTVYADGEKAGFFHFLKNEDNLWELDDLYVFSEFQNLGIGSEIISECLKMTDEPVMLYVFKKNTRAIALYERFGFEIEKNAGDSRYIMLRDKN